MSLLVLTALVFLLLRVSEVERLLSGVRHADLRWIALAVVIFGAGVVAVAATLRAVYRALGMEERIEHLLVLGAASFFANLILVSPGVGATVFTYDAKQRHLPPGKVTAALLLHTMYDYLAFTLVLGLALALLLERHQLRSQEIVASIAMGLAAFALAAALYLAVRSPPSFIALVSSAVRVVNRVSLAVLRAEYLDEEDALAAARDMVTALRVAARGPRDVLLLPAALALSHKALQIAVLFILFMAFSQPFGVGTLLVGFSIGYLFQIISPTPSGIGFVESTMTLALTWMGIPFERAAAIVLAYRAITVWLYLAAGIIAFRHLMYTAGRKQPTTPEQQPEARPLSWLPAPTASLGWTLLILGLKGISRYLF